MSVGSWPVSIFAERAVEGQMLVGVGHVLDRRQQEGDAIGPPRRRQHHEGHVLLGPLGPEPRGIDPARHARRHGPFEVHLPAGVVKIVVVEVDGAVLVPRVAPAHLLAREIPPGHAARGQVDDLAVAMVGGTVGNPDRRDVSREIPGAQDVGREAGRDRLVPHALDLQTVQGAADQPGRIDLAVVESVHQRAALLPPLEGAGHDDRRAVPERRRPDIALRRAAVFHARVRQQRLLIDRDPAGLRVVARGGEIPVAFEQRPANRDSLDRAVRQAEAKRDGARLVDDEGEAGLPARVPTW